MLLPAVSADDAALLQRLERLESGIGTTSIPVPAKPAEPEPEPKFVRPSQRKAMEEAKAAGHIAYDDLVVDTEVAKVSVVGIGMRSHAGVAAKMFKALAAENVNIKVISTSEIKISVLIDRKYMELAVQALHDTFDLDKA